MPMQWVLPMPVTSGSGEIALMPMEVERMPMELMI